MHNWSGVTVRMMLLVKRPCVIHLLCLRLGCWGWLPGGYGSYGMAMRGRIAHASGGASLRGPGAGRTRGP